MPKTVAERRKKLLDQIKVYEGKIKIIKAQIAVLQVGCEHPNLKVYKNYLRDECDIIHECPDCGYHKRS